MIKKNTGTIKWKIGLISISWLAMLGFDFFLHAGLLAKLYTQPSQFLLSADEAFIRIPLGYVSFLILALILFWLMQQYRIEGWEKGFLFGLKLGFLAWGAFILGLFSISTAEPLLLLGWWAGQTIELGVAGVVIGSGFSGTSLRTLLFMVGIFVIALVAVTILFQILELAPPMKVVYAEAFRFI